MHAVIALATEEKARLRELEAVVRRGVKTFVEVGNALREIRDKGLYRETHKSFEVYAKERWNIERRHAYRLMDSAEVAESLCPIGHKNPRVKEISTEGQMRELADVPDDILPEVIDKAAEIAGKSRITAKALRKAKQEVYSDSEGDVATDTEIESDDDADRIKWDLDYPVHPILECFPMMTPAEFEGFKRDIEQHGLCRSITLWRDMIIDGRNRLKACVELGIEPDFEELDESYDPVSYCISHNLYRVHHPTTVRDDASRNLKTQKAHVI